MKWYLSDDDSSSPREDRISFLRFNPLWGDDDEVVLGGTERREDEVCKSSKRRGEDYTLVSQEDQRRYIFL